MVYSEVEYVNPTQVEYKKYFHPHANRMSPYEEWKHAIVVLLTSIVQFSFDVF